MTSTSNGRQGLIIPEEEKRTRTVEQVSKTNKEASEVESLSTHSGRRLGIQVEEEAVGSFPVPLDPMEGCQQAKRRQYNESRTVQEKIRRS